MPGVQRAEGYRRNRHPDDADGKTLDRAVDNKALPSVTLRSNVSIKSPASVCRPKPNAMLIRGSIRLMKPAAMNPTSIPTTPASDHLPDQRIGIAGLLLQREGGNSTIGVKFSMP